MAGSKRGIEAGRAYVRASLDDSAFLKGLKGMRGALGSFGRGLPSIASGIYIFKELGNVVQSVGSKIMETIQDIAAIDRVRKAFGITAEAASGLFGVFNAAGATNARENVESLVTLSGRITDAMKGAGASKETQKMFKGLSVSAAELSQLPLDEQFYRFHEALMQLPDPVDRVNRLMLAFGEDGGKTLLGTLSMSTEELRKQAEGYKISAKEAEDANRAQAAMRKLTEAVAKAWQKVALTVAPIIVQVVDAIMSAARGVSEWVRQNAALQTTLEVLKTILGSMGVGDWASAWNVALANLKFRVAEAADWIHGVWIDATAGWAMLFTDLSATIQGVWANMLTALIGGLQDAVATMLNLAADMAEKLGKTDQANSLRMLALGASVSGNVARNVAGPQQQAAIERERQANQETLAEDAARRRAGVGGNTARAARELADAMAEAREETEKRTQAVAAVPELPPAAQQAIGKADTATNTAAILGTSGAAEAILRAVTGVREDGAEGAVKDLHKTAKDQLKEQREMRRQGVVLAEGKTK